MKNTLFAIGGIVTLIGLGYAIFSRPSDTGVTQLAATSGIEKSTISPAGERVAYVPGAYQDFSQAAYDAALSDGKTVILDFHADWCPTCRANEPIITSVFESNTDTNIVGFKVDYDNEIELKRTYNIASQSTIIKTGAGGGTKQLGPGTVTTKSFATFIQS